MPLQLEAADVRRSRCVSGKFDEQVEWKRKESKQEKVSFNDGSEGQAREVRSSKVEEGAREIATRCKEGAKEGVGQIICKKL